MKPMVAAVASGSDGGKLAQARAMDRRSRAIAVAIYSSNAAPTDLQPNLFLVEDLEGRQLLDDAGRSIGMHAEPFLILFPLA